MTGTAPSTPQVVIVGNRTNPRTLPYRGACYDFIVVQQGRENIPQHVWAGCWQKPQRTPILPGARVDRNQIEGVFVVESIPLVSIFDHPPPAQAFRKRLSSTTKHRVNDLRK